MNIGSKQPYPANVLSNFSPHPFVLDDVLCNSMEGFLQSLKFKSIPMQGSVCKMVGLGAKKKGAGKNWQRSQTLYWRGIPIPRKSDLYQTLLDRAYEALYKNVKFRRALEMSGNATLTHSIGRSDKAGTVITKQEFCSRLTKLRSHGTLTKPTRPKESTKPTRSKESAKPTISTMNKIRNFFKELL